MTCPGAFSFQGISGGYGDTVVLRDIGAELPRGGVLGVLGRNGVGKSTLLKLLMGYNKPSQGVVKFGCLDLRYLAVHERSRAGLGYAPQEGVVFDGLTVRDNLALHRPRRGLDDHEPLFEQFPRIRERLAQPAGSLSGGEKKLLSFVRVVADRKAVTLMDEPTEGVQQENIDKMAGAVRKRAAEGASFVIVEQNLAFLLQVMDQVLVLDHGQAVFKGSVPFDRVALEKHLQV